MHSVLAYSSDRIQPEEWLNSRLRELYLEPFVVIKQICVCRERGSSGLGTSLYRHVMQETSGKTLCVNVTETSLLSWFIVEGRRLERDAEAG